MGYGYELICKKCGYTKVILLGIGFSYPMVCADTLEAMKKGEYGEGFMEDANKTEHAAVHQERVLLVCDKCGNWRLDETIDLCAPIGEYKAREERFCVAVDYPNDVPYVMSHDIGRSYKIIRSKKHLCGKCRHDLHPMKKKDRLACPECGERLTIGAGIDWD